MISFTQTLAFSTLLALTAVVTAQECPSNVSETFVATIDNSTYFSTCAEGTTFSITSAFDVFNFTDADLLTFCDSDKCLEPIHKLMRSLDCNITYRGTALNLSAKVSRLHDLCHDILDAVGSSSHSMSGDMDGDAHDSVNVSGASYAVLAAGSVAYAVILAVIFA
ncbi:unnamed protein product [Peronospora belbahrii]|uniref:Elicitin n=1 Tax=Peronospora belbahrii TaxID=622444 RepID=A0ABN8D3P8_9STRA|nr:unnamed protein product [Peronospora belbahrii]